MAETGRPRMIRSAEHFQLMVDMYVSRCQELDEPMTITGLAIALGLSSREALSNYEQDYPEFLDVAKKARLLVENSYEKLALRKQGNVAGPIFCLKQMGWADRQEIAHSGISVTISDKDAKL
jgi:hypothetical protein